MPPQGSRLFHFDMQNFWKLTTSGVDNPLYEIDTPLWEVLDPPLLCSRLWLTAAIGFKARVDLSLLLLGQKRFLESTLISQTRALSQFYTLVWWGVTVQDTSRMICRYEPFFSIIRMIDSPSTGSIYWPDWSYLQLHCFIKYPGSRAD